MTTFFRLMDVDNKEASLKSSICKLSNAEVNKQTHIVNPEEFLTVPGAPFAYWVSSEVRKSFAQFESTETDFRTARQGLATSDDFRFVRTSWEVVNDAWVPFAKGGDFSPYYSDVHLMVNWLTKGEEIKANLNDKGEIRSNIWMLGETISTYFFKPGLTWPRRTSSSLSFRAMPSGCIFADKGPVLFNSVNTETLMANLAIVSSAAYSYLLSLQLAAADTAARSYEVGLIKSTPFPDLSNDAINFLGQRAKKIWHFKRVLDSINETSHAFLLPKYLLNDELGDFKQLVSNINLLQLEIDQYCFNLFNFTSGDEILAKSSHSGYEMSPLKFSLKQELEMLLSWCVGVIFGRFDFSIYGQNHVDSYSTEPFSKLSKMSPGMLGKHSTLYHNNSGVLTNDDEHQHSLPNILNSLLEELRIDSNLDLSKWLKKDFFNYHIRNYTKSRRQSPIYWPLQTPSGSYTLWLYYPKLNNQTLYSCVNTFVEPKLKMITDDIIALRNKSTRSTSEDNELSSLLEFEDELKNFKDELLRVAQFWKPNLDDGVQVNSAPLWKFFQHKVWQKKLKKTWEELEQGKYDWSHLAYNSWPERVLKQCQQDRSIAIAHGVEADLWVEIEVMAANGKDIKMEWQPRELTSQDYSSFVQQQVARLKES